MGRLGAAEQLQTFFVRRNVPSLRESQAPDISNRSFAQLKKEIAVGAPARFVKCPSVARVCAIALVFSMNNAGAQSTDPRAGSASASAHGQMMGSGNPAEGVSGAQLIGATVLSKDHRVVGVIDDVVSDDQGQTQKLVIGFAGFLGLGEKDVAISPAGIQVSRRGVRALGEELGDGKYTGSGAYRVTVPLTFQELSTAPAYSAGSTGAPSANAGTPGEVQHKEPTSSTKSGGPG